MLAPVLACPVCGDPLAAEPAEGLVRRLLCTAGHAYDVARQGYVSLLRGRHRHRGDTAEMVEHRLAVLSAGHYLPIADAVLELARECPASGVLLDIGGGPGWYSAHLLDALPDQVGVTFDAATAAARRAARAHPRLASVLADGTAAYPLQSDSVAVAICIFAPRDGAEIARVLAPGGRLVVVTPLPGHLGQLRNDLGLLSVAEDKDSRLERSLAGLVRRDRRSVRRTLRMSHHDAGHMVLMGPSAFHLSADLVHARLAGRPEPLEVDLDVDVQAFAVP